MKEVIVMRKKTLLIILSLLFILGLVVYIIYDRNFESKNDKDNKITDKFSVIAKKYDLIGDGPKNEIAIYGIDSAGKLTKIVSNSRNNITTFDVYKNYLYYILNYHLYRINLLDDNYISQKLFEVNIDWNIKVDDKYAYISGLVEAENQFQLYSYNLSTGEEKVLSKEINSFGLLDIKNNMLYYTKSSNNSLYQYNLKNNTEKTILEDARALYISDKKIYITKSIYDSESPKSYIGEEYYIIDKQSNKMNNFNGELNKAIEYDNKVIYLNKNKIMQSTYDGKIDLIYDFKDMAESVENIVPMKDNLLVIAGVTLGYVGLPEKYAYYMLNLKTKKITELEGDYQFLGGNIQEYVILK